MVIVIVVVIIVVIVDDDNRYLRAMVRYLYNVIKQML